MVSRIETKVGIRAEIYSAEASLFVLAAGAKLIERGMADFLYLSLTDYMQHKFAPHTPESLDFYQRIDTAVGRMLESGAVVGITADHGMNAKNKEDGETECDLPRVATGQRIRQRQQSHLSDHRSLCGPSRFSGFRGDGLSTRCIANGGDRRVGVSARRDHRGVRSSHGRQEARVARRSDRRLDCHVGPAMW